MEKDKSRRVFRGGSCNSGDLGSDVRHARVAYRGWYIPSFRYNDLGFRLSRVVNPLGQLSEVLDEQ